MKGHKQFVDKVVLRFQLSERVPKQNLYRRLAELLDWDFLYERTQSLYSHTGQPSLDPVAFFKLMLVSRLENLFSDRRLVEHYSLRLDILYFLGYEVDEDLPWHSTISRTRQLFPAAIFEQLFEHVFAQCVAAGLVTGHTQAVDSAPVKANASLENLGEKQSAEVLTPPLHVAGEPVPDVLAAPAAALLSSPAHELRRVATTHARYLRHDSGPLGRDRDQARLLSNKTHYSPTDPDARISVKPGKVRALNYLCGMAVDEGHGLISHIQADFADRRDSVLLESIVVPLHHRLLTHDLPVREVVADTNYSNGVNYALLEARGKSTCAPKVKKWQLIRTAYAPHYRRALTRQQSRQGRYMRRLRQRTIEPVFGSLLQHYGPRRVNTRGRSSAHKTMLLTAIAFNLKKLLKHQPKHVLCRAIALPKPPPAQRLLSFWRSYYHR